MILAALSLAALSLVAAAPASDPNAGTAAQESKASRALPSGEAGEKEAAAEPEVSVEAARALLDKDDYEGALSQARKLLERDPNSVPATVLLGDALYRRGDFDESETAYRKAVAADPNDAAAQFGVGRILRTEGKYGDAAEFFHKAAALDPNNPKYIRTLANHLAKRKDVIALLTHYLEMPAKEEESIRKNTAAWIALLKFLGDEPLGEVVSAKPTVLPLNVLKGQAYLKADVNKRKNERFAFDTGATGMTISPRLAKSAKVKRIEPFSITGMGGKGTVKGDLVLIRDLKLGGIALHNVAATVAEPKGPEEGLMGPAMFGRFKIEIDLANGTLAIKPFDQAVTSDKAAKVSFRNVGGQIVVPASLDGTTLNAMIDTGSQSSLASFSAVPRVPDVEVLSAALSRGRSFGLGGEMTRKTIRTGTFGFAGMDFKADGMPCVDLSHFSHVLESEIYLVVGFPELAKFTLGIDYRTNMLDLTPHP